MIRTEMRVLTYLREKQLGNGKKIISRFYSNLKCNYFGKTVKLISCQENNVLLQQKRNHTKAIITPCPKACATLQMETCFPDPCFMDPCMIQPKIVIIGAGMAGLSAAHRLSMCGYNNFVVVEATDRPGGRIHSCWLGNVVGEMGAQWISGGSEGNPIFTLACMEGLLKEPLSERKSVANLIHLISDGRAIEDYTASIGKGIFEEVKRQAFTLFSTDTNKGHGSLKNFMDTRLKEELKLVPLDWREDASRVAFGLTNTIKTRWGTELSSMSADIYGSYIKIPGNPVRVPLGFVGVLGPLLKAIPKEKIVYCREVKTIKWDGDKPRVTVTCCEGNVFEADYCLVTCSLGVLKKNHFTMFKPNLPKEKIDAINVLGYGHLNKIVFEYARPFWASGEGSMAITWTRNEMDDKCCWTKGISVIEEVPGGTDLLMTTVGGHEAQLMEECTDEEVAILLTQVIRTFTGDFSLPFPTNIIRSKWSCDKFFCGAGSYLSLHARVKDQCELGRPLADLCTGGEPILLFAGEATAPGHFSTVQGARLSGIREAERILKLARKNGGSFKHESKAAIC